MEENNEELLTTPEESVSNPAGMIDGPTAQLFGILGTSNDGPFHGGPSTQFDDFDA